MPNTRLIRPTVRTCVGCGQTAATIDLVRAVQDGEGGVAVDVAPLGPRPRGVIAALAGRGAWLHARPRCVEGAARRGFARSFRAALKVGPAVLTLRLRAAAAQRVYWLLQCARRAGGLCSLTPGNPQLGRTTAFPLLLLARDADLSAAERGELAARARSTVAWGTGAELARALGNEQAGTLAVAVLDERIAQALSRALEMVYVPGPVADGAGPKACSEVG